MAYQEKTTTTYGSRLSNSLKGIVFGLIAFIVGTVLLFWNEGNFVKTKRALTEAEGAVVSVASVDTRAPELEGKLIHASAKANTADVLSDSAFGVSENAIALAREVEYYQWVEESKTETRDKMGGGQEKITTYTYKKKWCSDPEDSLEFHDPAYQGKNWTWLRFDEQTQYADTVTFGAYVLPDFFVESITGAESAQVQPTAEQTATWTATIAKNPHAPAADNADDEETVPPAQWVHTDGSTVYFGLEPATPAIGDVRVTFSKVPPKEVSLIGRVQGDTFVKYVAKNGRTVSRLEVGMVSAEEMFAHAQSENCIFTWLFRLLGVVLVCGGLRGIFGILEALAKVIPPLGTIVGAGITLVSLVLGGAWSLLWIAIAWLTYRPLVGIPLLVVAVGGLIWLKGKSRKAAAPTA